MKVLKQNKSKTKNTMAIDPKDMPTEGEVDLKITCNMQGCNGYLKAERKIHDFTDWMSQPLGGPSSRQELEVIEFWCAECGVSYNRKFIIDSIEAKSAKEAEQSST